MTTTIAIAGAEFTKSIENVFLPFLDEAELFVLPGTDFATSTENLAPNGVATATVIGSPTYGAAYISTTQAIGLEFAMTADWPYTMIAAGRYTSGAPQYMGPWKSGASNGQLGGAANTTTTISMVGSTRSSIVGAAETDFVFHAAAYDGATARAWRKDRAGLRASAASYVTAQQSGGFCRVGAGSSPSGAGDVAAAIFYPRVLTTKEVLQLYRYLKKILPVRGITFA